MPLQNRVLPDQSIVADPSRGLFTGNRGILHDETRTLRRRWTSKAWICCALQWKDTRRLPMSPHTWTELFFLDEAVALAAGHRPCATCRRTAYAAFRAAWARAQLPGVKAPEMDSHLHATRLTPTRQQRRFKADAATLPDGTFIWHGKDRTSRDVTETLPDRRDLHGTPHLILADQAFPYTPSGYLPPVRRPNGAVLVMTPHPIVAVLQSGYQPTFHPSLSIRPV